LLGLLVAFDVLYDHFGFAILGDDEWLLLLGKVSYDFSGMVLQVADGPDLIGQFHEDTLLFGRDLI
jgi:hypothetical protein